MKGLEILRCPGVVKGEASFQYSCEASGCEVRFKTLRCYFRAPQGEGAHRTSAAAHGGDDLQDGITVEARSSLEALLKQQAKVQVYLWVSALRHVVRLLAGELKYSSYLGLVFDIPRTLVCR